jgi:DNA polymerase III subunit epsilon
MNWFFRRRNLPEVVQAYLDATPKRVNRKTPVDELSFLVIDAETTGLNVRRDKLLSLAGVRVKGGQINLSQLHSWVVFQDNVNVNEAASVHCILPSDTRSGLPEPLVIEEMLPDLQGAILVGHHVQFDAMLLNEALRRRFQVGLRNPVIDTADLAMHAIDAFAKTGYANQRPPTLDEVCAHCGIPMMERHTAAGDAYTTAELFLLLCAKLRQRYKRPLVAGDLPMRSL